MISQMHSKFKYLTQKIYNKYIYSILFSACKCSCGATGRFIMHGYYNRSLKTPFGKIKLRILRVKCKSCGTTHAVLHPCIIPYSQIPLSDAINIIDAYETKSSYVGILNNNPEITESDVRHIIKRYCKYWRQKILSIATCMITWFLSSHTLLKSVSEAFNQAFLQIKRCSYLVF